MKSQSQLSGYVTPFVHRHIGPRRKDVEEMLQVLEVTSLDELIKSTIPEQIYSRESLNLAPSRTEAEVFHELRSISKQNQVFRSFLGMGYSDCITPAVIQRNILENPGWYTQYTPYQAEISQGRLEALLNFQTMISDLTGLPVANASMLDEGTAAAEAMSLCFAIKNRNQNLAFFVSHSCHPQTIAIIKTRAEPLGIHVIIEDPEKFDFSVPIFGALLQYPATDGKVFNYKKFIDQVHAVDALAIIAADLLSLALFVPPGEMGADVAVGSAQRFGVPMGYGGPHAAYFATLNEYKRQIPGRIVGVSVDANGSQAIRLALQTREQHIRRDKATSNICTAQVLLAVIASMYAVYHGPEGIKQIAERIYLLTAALKEGLKKLGYEVSEGIFFDTLRLDVGASRLEFILKEASAGQMNFRVLTSESLTISLDETTTEKDLSDLLAVFGSVANSRQSLSVSELIKSAEAAFEINPGLKRKSSYLSHKVFNSYRSETEMLRYMHRLQSKDLSLVNSMIPLGSCTMKLNATSEMLPISWPEFAKMHPFAPLDQASGYQKMLSQLESFLVELTGFSAFSLQPNAGSQGEYAGLLVIRKYHQTRNEGYRDICLIPRSAHGTNPASAAMAGMKIVAVECDSMGNIDVQDLKSKAEAHQKNLAALMMTYPSTHGVFEETVKEVCEIVHQFGGQVYMDGANMNAQIGLCMPGKFGPDVCHLNLHKTFCIPHGGGGPGMGPIGVRSHLAPFLPSHPVIQTGGEQAIGPVSAAPWGSASILPISWMYIAMMGGEGLKYATQIAILNANYIAKKLNSYYPVLYRGKNGFVAHECIFDLRQFKTTADVEVEDVAKRLMDYGFHAPTISFPVAGTMMVEPTESESKEELDRFCEALILIREEIAEIEQGKVDRKNNLLKNAPHTARKVTESQWTYPYSREKAAFPTEGTKQNKFWPAVARVNNVAGDRNLICTCPSMEAYEN